MKHDDRLTQVRSYANVLAGIEGEEGPEILRVEVGDYSGSTVDFVQGRPPAADEIALSVLNAKKYGATPGDSLAMRIGGIQKDYRVSGVYQDVTSGGFTAKLHDGSPSGLVAHAVAFVLYADTVTGANPVAVATEYRERFSAATVIPMRAYVQQTLEYVTSAFRSAAIVTFAFGISVAVLLTALFLKLRLARDRRTMGVLSAVGFSAREIIAQVRGKTLAAVLVGTVLGLAFTATLGESLVGGLIALAGLGITQLSFIPAPWLVYGIYPLALLGAGYFGAVLLTAPLRHADKSAWLKG
jgi:putative ABC transport system permease protein